MFSNNNTDTPDVSLANVLTIAPKVEDVTDFNKLSVLLRSHKKAGRSIVWRYFGTLVYKDESCEPTIISNDSYCDLCFQDGLLHSYKYSSSSTNLTRHLVHCHNISANNSEEKKSNCSLKREQDSDDSLILYDGKSDDINNLDSKNISSTCHILMKDAEDTWSTKSSVNNQQIGIINSLAAMCCKDLLPFDIIEGEGFRQFLVNLEVVNNCLPLPSSLSLQEEVFNNMFPAASKKVCDILNHSPSTLSLAVESHDDSSGSNLRYSKFKFNFANENFELVSITYPLLTSRDSVISNITHLEQLYSLHHLNVKSFFLIDENFLNEKGANQIEDGELSSLKVHKHYCLMHSLNNLINIDGLWKSEGFHKTLEQIHSIFNQSIKTSACSKRLLFAMKILEKVVRSTTSSKDSIDVTSDLPNHMPWYLLEEIIERILQHYMIVDIQEIEKNLIIDNLNDIKSLHSLLKKFSSAFEILNGSINASCSLVLLLRVEVETIVMTPSDEDTALSKSIKENMLASLESRFPITDLHVCAALLDPSQRNLPSIREFLFQNQLTSVEFLTNMIEKYLCRDKDSDEEIKNAKSSKLKEAKVELVDLSRSTQNDSPGIAPWKKMKLELLARQTNLNSTNALEREILKYLCMFLPDDGANDDPLTWWKEQKKTLPRLSNLARIILSLPAGCCNIRNIVQDENVCSKIHKLPFADDELNKFLFLHENFVNCSS